MAHPADRVIDHYERHARAWAHDRSRAAWNDKRWHDRFVAALPRGGSVLDVGCGGGVPVAMSMVAQGFTVTGVDTSPTLVSLCRERMPDQTWIVADMRTLALAERFDGVLAWDSFFHLNADDQRAMFEVFAHHCAARSILMFNAGPAEGEAIGSYRGDPLYHASLDTAEYATRLKQVGFDILVHAVEDVEVGGRTVWLAGSTTAGISHGPESG